VGRPVIVMPSIVSDVPAPLAWHAVQGLRRVIWVWSTLPAVGLLVHDCEVAESV
jgi:hypothetical protein